MAILTRRNWKTLRKQYLPKTVFFAITIISASLIVLPMWNYANFYIALNNFDYIITNANVSAGQLSTPSSTLVNISLTFLATNPTDYSGLHIGAIGCDLEYYATEGPYAVANWWMLTSAGSDQSAGPIGPNGNRTLLMEIAIRNPTQETPFWNFVSYLETNPKEIEWSITCRVTLITFLGTYVEQKTFSPIFTPLNKSTI